MKHSSPTVENQVETHAEALYQTVRQPVGFPRIPSDWTSEWETFPSHDKKVELFGVFHYRKNSQGAPEPSRCLIVFHGMGEHGGRYAHLPHFLQKTVGSVYCLDHRGHGRSSGLRGHADSFDQLVSDAAWAIRRLDERLHNLYGKSEIHVLGHSLGGHVVTRMGLMMQDLPIHSITASAPFLGIKVKVPAAKKAAASLLSNVWGTLQLATELDAKLLSHDDEVVRAYEEDRLVHNKMTPRFYTSLVKAMKDTLSRESGFTVRYQELVPLQDGLVDPECSLKFFRQLKHREKRLKTYPSFFHEPMNEVGKELVFEDIASWIQG